MNDMKKAEIERLLTAVDRCQQIAAAAMVKADEINAAIGVLEQSTHGEGDKALDTINNSCVKIINRLFTAKSAINDMGTYIERVKKYAAKGGKK